MTVPAEDFLPGTANRAAKKTPVDHNGPHRQQVKKRGLAHGRASIKERINMVPRPGGAGT